VHNDGSTGLVGLAKKRQNLALQDAGITQVIIFDLGVADLRRPERFTVHPEEIDGIVGELLGRE
jgi:hypothetical protein